MPKAWNLNLSQLEDHPLIKYTKQFDCLTRMHSRRMCTGRSLTICRSVLPGGLCFPWGCFPGGVCFPGVCASRGVCFPGEGVCFPGEGGVLPGGYPSIHWGRSPPPVNRMTDRCKNITLATTSLRPVKTAFSFSFNTHYWIKWCCVTNDTLECKSDIICLKIHIYGHKKKECLEQNISIGSIHCSFYNCHYVSI